MTTLWPTTFASVQNDATGSPLPSIWVIGATKTGKSSFMASTLAKKPLILDFDGSWATLKYHIPGKVIDMRLEAAKIKDANIPLALFTAFWNVVSEIKEGEHDLIGIDGIEYIFEGSFQYVQKNPTMFGKAAGQFNGTMGTKFGWGTTKNDLWPFLIRTLESKCETVILISHPKDFVDKASGSKTGRQTFKGVDLTELVTLALWLFSPTDEDPDGNKPGTPTHKGKYWAIVRKNRLTWFFKQENGFPRQHALLPTKLVLETGASYPELIYGYMNAPKPDYGELNNVKGDPTRIEMSEEDKKVIESQERDAELELIRLKIEEAITNEKNHLVRVLVGPEKLYATPAALGERIKALGYEDYTVMRNKVGFEAAVLELSATQKVDPVSPAPAKDDPAPTKADPDKDLDDAIDRADSKAAAKMKAEAEAKLKAEQAAKDKAITEERDAILKDLVGEGKVFKTATELKDQIIMLGYHDYADMRAKLSFDAAVKLLHPEKAEPVLEPVASNGAKAKK